MGSEAKPAMGLGQVFLSHAGADSSRASDLAEVLRSNGLFVWLDKDSLSPGSLWQEGIERAIEQSSAMLVYVGSLGVSAFVELEVRAGLVRNRKNPHSFVIIPVLGEGADPSMLPLFLSQYQFVDLRNPQSAPKEIRRLIETLSQPGGISALPSEYWETHSPFRSLQTFKEEDAWLFFGRDTETQELLKRLSKNPVLTVLGNSGSGKSSLVLAGLIPALRRGRFEWHGCHIDQWRIVTVRPSGDPFRYLAETLANQLPPEMPAVERERMLEKWLVTLPTGGHSLRNALVTLASSQAETNEFRTLVLVDQFEELFTLTHSRDIRTMYIDALLTATTFDGVLPTHLVLTMRADFYSQCLNHENLSRNLESNIFNVSAMNRAHLQESIEKRICLSGARMEQGLVNRLLDDVGSEPGNLALLEHALGQLWSRRRGPQRTLDTSTYLEIGGLRGSLSRHADEVLASLESDKERCLAKDIFMQLVQLGEGAPDTRRRVRKGTLLSLREPAGVEKVMARLASERLITTGADPSIGSATEFVEVGHETLIRDWPQLREWIAQNREEISLQRYLEQEAEQWQRLGRDPQSLLRGSSLSLALNWLNKGRLVPQEIREYVDVSSKFQELSIEKERELRERQFRRTRRFLFSIVGLLLVAVVSALLWSRQAYITESETLASEAEALVQRDQPQALGYGLKAWHIEKTTEARSVITRAFPRLLVTLHGHSSKANRIIFRDDRHLITIDEDHRVRAWDAYSGELLATDNSDAALKEFLPEKPDTANAGAVDSFTLNFPRDGQILNGYQVAVSGKYLNFDITYGPISKAIISSHGQRVITVHDNGVFLLWDPHDCVDDFPGCKHPWSLNFDSENPVTRAEFSPSESRIVTVNSDQKVRVWNEVTGKLISTLDGYAAPDSAPNFSPDEQYVVAPSDDGTAQVWDTSNGSTLARIRSENAPITMAIFSPDGRRIVTLGADGMISIWSLTSSFIALSLKAPSEIYQARFLADGKHILLVNDVYPVPTNFLSTQSRVKVWKADGTQLEAALAGDTGTIRQASPSSDGTRIVAACGDGTPRVWDAVSGKMLAKLEGHTFAINWASFSPDDKRIVTASQNSTARLWSADSFKLLAILPHRDQVIQANFSPDARFVVTASEDKTARVWRADNGQPISVLKGHTEPVTSATFSPDSQRILTASDDKTARLWNNSGQLLATLQGHTGRVMSAVFSPDGQQVVTASDDATARIWNARDGQPVAILAGHLGSVTHVSYSPDGRYIVTASHDKTARVWCAKQGALVAILNGHTKAVNEASFSLDGTQIITASADGTARVYKLMTLKDIADILTQ
jgi:WD40 repeat protein